MPRVSINMPAYNHGKYIAEAIQSILDQSFEDFEIVITDDGSTDNTVSEIKKFKDPRIRLFEFKENLGAAFASRNNTRNARGEYIAMLSSDDMFLPGKLEKQVKYLDAHSDVYAVFGYAQVIDEDGADFEKEGHFYTDIFRQPNRTRHEWLRHFFYHGNCLCHPSVLARKEVYTALGLPDPRYAQLGDLYRWIRTCLKHEIHIIPENLIKFRVRAGELNASGSRPDSRKRSNFEFIRMFDYYLEIDSVEDLLKVFPEAEQYGRPEKELIPYFVARMAIESDSFIILPKVFGINVIFDLLGDEKMAARLESRCGFTHRDFIELTGRHDYYNIEAYQAKKDLEEKERQIDALLNSMSWKVTSPLRKALSLLKGVF